MLSETSSTHSYPNILEKKVIIPGPIGLLEGKMKLSDKFNSPVVIIFHPHPLHGGNMNNKIVHTIYKTFEGLNFHTLRINFRGVGNSQGKSIGGIEELEDALISIDWFIKKFQSRSLENIPIWVAGFSFGGWIALQAAMRRPEIFGFISVSPPVNLYSFNMLTPCPNGLIIQGDDDHIVALEDSEKFTNELIKQKGCEIEFKSLMTDHYYTNKLSDLSATISSFVEKFTNEE